MLLAGTVEILTTSQRGLVFLNGEVRVVAKTKAADDLQLLARAILRIPSPEKHKLLDQLSSANPATQAGSSRGAQSGEEVQEGGEGTAERYRVYY